MKNLLDYVDSKFSNELKLLVLLSQKKPDIDSLNRLFTLINWDEFITLVVKHRLASHVLQNINLINFIPQIYTDKLKGIKLSQTKTALLYSGYITIISKLLTDNNIPHLFFKGPLFSTELYNDIGFRNFRDIDLLVEEEHVEDAKKQIEDLNFSCIYPHISLSKIQKRVNYSISHHYHFKHKSESIHIELHWSITNPKSFCSISTKDILLKSRPLNIANSELPYISSVHNLVYLASHGSIHQWYRLFWLKDFSEFLEKTSMEELKEASFLAKKLKLHKCFSQALMLSSLLYKVDKNYGIPIKNNLIHIPLKSITTTDLGQQGVWGKLKFVFYRLQMKPDFNYYFSLIYRLRTHLTDWELLKIPSSLFFLYYILRPFLLIYKFLIKK